MATSSKKQNFAGTLRAFALRKEGLAVIVCVISNFLSLLGNVVIGYIIPWFDGKRGLAVALFAMVFISLLPFIFLSEREDTPKGKSAPRKPRSQVAQPRNAPPGFFDRIQAW